MFTCVILAVFVVVSCESSTDQLSDYFKNFQQYLYDTQCEFPGNQRIQDYLLPCSTDGQQAEKYTLQHRQFLCPAFVRTAKNVCQKMREDERKVYVEDVEKATYDPIWRVCEKAADSNLMKEFAPLIYNKSICEFMCEQDMLLSRTCKYIVASAYVFNAWESQQPKPSGMQSETT